MASPRILNEEVGVSMTPHGWSARRKPSVESVIVLGYLEDLNLASPETQAKCLGVTASGALSTC